MQDNKLQSFARRDRLLQIQEEAQQIWENAESHKVDPNDNQKKFFTTFPYPYMNGKLHLGHAFSMTKCEFQTRYKQMQGFNALWPFSFHCTGMPISASANRLKKELQNCDSDNLPTEKTSQYQILKEMGVDSKIIPNFQDPQYWLSYFPEIGKSDLKKFGACIDFRRSFITTDKNPYYDKFVQWHFNTLKKDEKVIFGKRPSVFSPEDGQMCADHDRREGEGVEPQEYTLIKMLVQDNQKLPQELLNRKVYLVAATLRPETMYGQTNIFALPEGVYGAYEMKNDEVYICSERSALNMAFQEITLNQKKIDKICDVSGLQLMGIAVKSPLCKYDKIYCLPMMSILMNKGTGIVTSVPSDSPDDYATLRDLKNKQQLREKFNITDEMVLPFDPVEIINIKEMGNLSAIAACDEFKIQSQNDKEKLVKAKEKCYKLGFYDGVFLVEEFKGKKVNEVKLEIRKKLIDNKESQIYWEPENKIISRLGDECVVALCDQWYIPYGDLEWKQKIKDHVLSDNFKTYNPTVKKNLVETIDWLKQWGCSRSFGLGTKLPWDPQYLIESLSDSTIYMSYYTIAHHIQGGIDGSQPGSLNITVDQIDDSFFDYVFLGKEGCTLDQEKLKILRKEFLYWYPMDLRCSGKDLIKNHLTMSLFNHQSVFQDKNLLPQAIFCNGYVQVNGEKMSKSLGNFLTLENLIHQYGSDASRIALASSGDNLDDANFELSNANAAILQLSQLEVWIQDTMKVIDQFRKPNEGDEKAQFYDKIFENEMNFIMQNIEKHYEQMKYRDVIKEGLHEFQHLQNYYKLNLGGNQQRQDLILQFIKYSLIILYPIAPHFSEIIYKNCYQPKQEQTIRDVRWPAQRNIDMQIINQHSYIKTFLRNIRLSLDKIRINNNKKKKETPSKFSLLQIIYSEKYQDWQIAIQKAIKSCGIDEQNKVKGNWRQVVKEQNIIPQELFKKAMAFGQQYSDEILKGGQDIMNEQMPIDEKFLLTTILDSIKKEINVEKIEIIELSNAQSVKNYEQYQSSVVPSKPQTIIE